MNKDEDSLVTLPLLTADDVWELLGTVCNRWIVLGVDDFDGTVAMQHVVKTITSDEVGIPICKLLDPQ